MVGMLTTSLVKYGKHKVPRFIYHLTNKETYNKILQSGELKVAQDAMLGEGIFTLELTNFFKHWRKNKSWSMDSLQKRLIHHTRKGKSELVILKIPTEKLDHNKLFVRSQNRLFSWADKCNLEMDKAIDEVVKENKIQLDENPIAREILEKIKAKIALLSSPKCKKEEISHLQGGTLAKNGKLFAQRKEALEYVYTESIPTANIEKIGEVDLKVLCKSESYDKTKPIRSVFTNLLAGTPEVKGAELLNC